jgi:NYN domain
MGSEDFEQLGQGRLRRKSKRIVGLFIDGVGLDRATRRLDRKVDLGRLVKGVTTGLKLELARYYTLIPHEDDARQFSFLDAVERAGLEVVVKRLPPIGVKRQVSVDIHMGVDLISFAYGQFHKSEEEESVPASPEAPVKRSALIVCPSRELSYGIYMANQAGVETSLADFGLYGTSDGWKGVDRWIDLSTSETIWR